MQNTLELTTKLPLAHYAPGDTVVREGDAAGGLWVLVSGALEIRKGTILVASVNKPGALIGEVSLLLKSAYSATVVATEPTTMRYAADGAAVLTSHPEIILRMAEGLAERLSFVTTYLATRFGRRL